MGTKKINILKKYVSIVAPIIIEFSPDTNVSKSVLRSKL